MPCVRPPLRGSAIRALAWCALVLVLPAAGLAAAAAAPPGDQPDKLWQQFPLNGQGTLRAPAPATEPTGGRSGAPRGRESTPTPAAQSGADGSRWGTREWVILGFACLALAFGLGGLVNSRRNRVRARPRSQSGRSLKRATQALEPPPAPVAVAGPRRRNRPAGRPRFGDPAVAAIGVGHVPRSTEIKGAASGSGWRFVRIRLWRGRGKPEAEREPPPESDATPAVDRIRTYGSHRAPQQPAPEEPTPPAAEERAEPATADRGAPTGPEPAEPPPAEPPVYEPPPETQGEVIAEDAPASAEDAPAPAEPAPHEPAATPPAPPEAAPAPPEPPASEAQAARSGTLVDVLDAQIERARNGHYAVALIAAGIGRTGADLGADPYALRQKVESATRDAIGGSTPVEFLVDGEERILWLILPGVLPRRTADVARHLRNVLDAEGVPAARLAVVGYPRDGTDAEELVARCRTLIETFREEQAAHEVAEPGEHTPPDRQTAR